MSRVSVRHGWLSQAMQQGAAVADPAAITQLAAPAGAYQGAEFGSNTTANMDLTITSLNAARADIAAVRTQLIALITALENANIIS